MKVPLAWLREYVSLALPPAELAHRLTMAGLETSYVPGASVGWGNVVVGRVVKLEPCPNADRLKLATVDLGNEALTVVCGAPNVALGQRVAFARIGASLIDPKTGERVALTTATIRGIKSEGMVCSERELGLGNDHTGVLVLPEEAPVGEALASYLPGDVLELEVTANRGDCLSMLGVAHEVATITGGTVTELPLEYEEAGPDIDGLVSVRIDDPELCSRYAGSVVQGIRVGESPAWLQRRLTAAGVRPISNVVDVTNYVMLEYGQPLHAFDLSAVRQGAIVVRAARDGERHQTLDGEERSLRPPMLVIADPERAIGLAGVMGGANSEITDATTDILIESATFNPINTRRTAMALGLRSEASFRFERGLNPELALRALQRATALMLTTAGGRAARGVADAFPGAVQQQPIPFSHRRLHQVLGVDFPHAQVVRVLSSLGFQCESAGDGAPGEALQVTPPYWRTDVSLEDDVVEEVTRTIGYDAVPTEPLSGGLPDHLPQPHRDLRHQVRELLVAAGLQETICYSLVSHSLLEQAGALGPGKPQPLRVSNPMSRDQEYLRTTLRGSILQTLATGLRQPPGSLRLFEVGRVYLPRDSDLPEEREMVVGALAGPRGESPWTQRTAPLDFYDAKSALQATLEGLGLRADFQRGQDELLHPGRTAQVSVNGEAVGIVGELHPRTRERFDLTAPTVVFFELDLDRLVGQLPMVRSRYQPFPKFPVADRDLALVVEKGVPAERLHQILEDHPLVSRAVLFDQYTGSPLPPGTKSLAFQLELQSATGTLNAEQVNQVVDSLLERLRRETGARVRT